MLNKLVLCIYAAAALQASAVAQTVIAPDLPVRAGILAARIEADKTSYRLGEPIRLRLTLVNRTGAEVYYVAAAPYEISSLHVSKDGHQLSPSGGLGPCVCEGRTYTIPLEPGKPFVVEYNDKRSNGALRQWAYIQDWGYKLTEAGSYSISVSASVNAIGASGPEFQTASAGKSNVLHITILK